MFICTLLYVHSSNAIILMGKRELVALLYLSSWCLVVVEWLFLLVPWGYLRFMIVVFLDHTHLLLLFFYMMWTNVTIQWSGTVASLCLIWGFCSVSSKSKISIPALKSLNISQVHFQFNDNRLNGDVPGSPFYGVYISQLIHFARVCTTTDTQS